MQTLTGILAFVLLIAYCNGTYFTVLHTRLRQETKLICGSPTGVTDQKWTHNNHQHGEYFPSTSVNRDLTIWYIGEDYAGDYICEWNDGKNSSKAWLITVPNLPLDGLKYEYKAVTSKPLQLDCCVRAEIEVDSIAWRRNNVGIFSGNGEKYELEDGGRRLIIKDFSDTDAGEYKCTINYFSGPINRYFVVTVGTANTNKPSCTNLLVTGSSSTVESVELVGTVRHSKRLVTYQPGMNEWQSEEHQSLTKLVCSAINFARRDTELKGYFDIPCRVLLINPITQNVVTRLEIDNLHRLYAGMEVLRRSSETFAKVMLLDPPQSKTKYNFQIHRAENKTYDYETVFIEGPLHIDDVKIDFDEEYPTKKHYLFKKLTKQICSLIEDSRAKHIVMRECPVACYGYGVDVESVFVIQLVVSHADLRKINIDPNERTVWKKFEYWLAGMKTENGSLKYVPKLIKPVVHATGTVYEEGEVVLYDETILDNNASTERTYLEQKLQTKVNWFDAKTMNVGVNKSIPSKSQLVVTLFNSSKEMERRGMVLVRNYHNRINQVKPREAGVFRFSVHKFERESIALATDDKLLTKFTLLHKMAVSSTLVEQVQGYDNLCNNVTVEYRYNSSALEHECKVLNHDSVDSSVTVRLRLNQEEFLEQNPIDYTIKWKE